jgi:hypothetical protein
LGGQLCLTLTKSYKHNLKHSRSGQPVEKVLQALPDEAHDLEALIKLASAVRELPHPEFEFEKAQAATKILAASQAITRPARRRPVPGGSLRWFTTPGSLPWPLCSWAH